MIEYTFCSGACAKLFPVVLDVTILVGSNEYNNSFQHYNNTNVTRVSHIFSRVMFTCSTNFAPRHVNTDQIETIKRFLPAIGEDKEYDGRGT